eukprot:gnl/TRDRNA2_/TRDRNA2_177700_c2_seq22.p1 gnl/TRDRNA2_/TRDRNA2_177700_c2~~gnl/TRDRNA2_/TRDRNA2_177700_c2_seq22.p1  ORF type:complete len:221 (+),score=19.16 gnl/TRDRNA2_/TRDRNA2_177700_c2_seq22:97-759(+)
MSERWTIIDHFFPCAPGSLRQSKILACQTSSDPVQNILKMSPQPLEQTTSDPDRKMMKTGTRPLELFMIGDQTLSDSVQEMSAMGAAMVVKFETAEGTPVSICFTQRPLGLVFDRRAPSIVDDIEPSSFAEQLGVRRGWRMTSVSGHDLSNEDFQFQCDLLSVTSSQLPNAHVVPPGSSHSWSRRLHGVLTRYDNIKAATDAPDAKTLVVDHSADAVGGA